MKRFRKAILILIRELAYRIKHKKFYYWAELRVFDLRSTNVFSDELYCKLYRLSTSMVEKRKCLKTANWLQHRIPFNIRCYLA